MISRKAVRECDKWCRNYQANIESEEHCELKKYSEKLQVLQPRNKSKPVRIAQRIKNKRNMRVCVSEVIASARRELDPKSKRIECIGGYASVKHLQEGS